MPNPAQPDPEQVAALADVIEELFTAGYSDTDVAYALRVGCFEAPVEGSRGCIRGYSPEPADLIAVTRKLVEERDGGKDA